MCRYMPLHKGGEASIVNNGDLTIAVNVYAKPRFHALCIHDFLQ